MNRDHQYIVLAVLWFGLTILAATYPFWSVAKFDADRQVLLWVISLIPWLIGRGVLATERLDALEDRLGISRD